MLQNSRPRSKRFIKSWFVFALICLAVTFFYKPLLLLGCKLALYRVIPKKEGRIISYEKMQWEERTIAISGLQIKDPNREVTIDHVALQLSRNGWQLQPKITISHPQILISSASGENVPAAAFLYRNRFIQPHWEIRNGVLQLPTSGRFYFTMFPGDEKESIGHLVFSSDPDPHVSPMFSATLALIEDNVQVGFKLQESDLSRLLALTALMFQEIPRKWERAGGEIQLEGLVYLDPSFRLKELHCQGEGKQIAFTSSAMGIDLQWEEIKGAFSYPLADATAVLKDQLSASVILKGGNCLIDEQFGIKNFEGSFDLEPKKEPQLLLNGNLIYQGREISFGCVGKGTQVDDVAFLSKIEFKGKEGNLKGEVKFSGPKGDCLADINIEGDGREILTWLSDHKLPTLDPLPLELRMIATINNASEFKIDAMGSISEEPIQGFALFSVLNSPSPGTPLGHLPRLLFKEAKWQAEHLTEKSYGPFISLLVPGIEVAGHLQCQAAIGPSMFQLKLNGNEILVQHSVAQLYLPRVQEKSIQFNYDNVRKQWQGEIPLDEGQLNIRENNLSLDHLVGSLKLNVNADAEWDLQGHLNALKFPVNAFTSITEGHCDLIFDSKNQELVIERAEGIWGLLDGTPLTVQVKRCSAKFFNTAALDFAFKVIDGKREIAHFEGKAAHNDAEQWEIVFDKQKTYLGGTHLNITRCFLDEQMNLNSFEMCPILKCQDLHTQAAFLQNAGFLSKAFSAKNLQDWQFEGTLQTRLYSEDADKGFSFHAESRDLKVRGKPWNSFLLKAHKIGENWLIEHLEGGGLTLKGAFVVDGSELSLQRFDGKWKGIELKGSGHVKMDQNVFSCNFESVKGDLSSLAQVSNFPIISSWKGGFFAEGCISVDFSNLHDFVQLGGAANVCIDLETPLALAVKNRKTIRFTCDPSNGLVCNPIDLELKDQSSGASIAEFTAEKLVWPPKGNFMCEKIAFSLSPKIIQRCSDANILPLALKDLRCEANLEGSGDVQLSPGPIFQATLKPGRYGIGSKDLPFEQLQLRYEKDLLTMRGKTQIEKKPLWGTLQVDLSKEPFGVLKLFDHPKSEGLKLLFTTLNGKIFWESAQGSCYGIDCALIKNNVRKVPLATVLSGHVKIDGHILSSLLPEEIREGCAALKIGKGYGWQGDLILWQESKRGFEASGTITGDAFEFLGYQFHHLQGNLEVTPEHIFISELKMDDSAGVIGIKKLELNKNQRWNLYIPQIFVRHLQPSLMHKIDGEPPIVKPFTLKNFSLTEIRCVLGDMSTLEGSGKLTFANQFKKESSLFDTPFEMIKKIGLDPNLLTPVQGELEIELRGDKFYLMSLKNSFSEGQRAEFYLAPGKELSYIDLNGKIQIDLKMHQDVMLKITEPFTLTIRGTLEKPRYGLQY